MTKKDQGSKQEIKKKNMGRIKKENMGRIDIIIGLKKRNKN